MSINTIYAIFDAAPGPIGGRLVELRIQGERVDTPPAEADGRIPIGGYYLVLDDDQRFVEVEDEGGSSVSVGGWWHEASEDRWALVWEHDTNVGHTMPDAMGYSVSLHVAAVLCNALAASGIVPDGMWNDSHVTGLNFFGDLAMHVMVLAYASIDDRMEASDVAVRLDQCIRAQFLLWDLPLGPEDDAALERVAARAARAHVRITERQLFHVRAQRDEEADRIIAEHGACTEAGGYPPAPTADTSPAIAAHRATLTQAERDTYDALDAEGRARAIAAGELPPDLESANRVSAQQVADADRVNELHSRRFDRT